LLPDDSVKALDPGTVRNRAHDALLSAIRAMAAGKPLLILAEDIQWMDAESLAVITRIGRDNRSGRTLILATYRGETEAGSRLQAAGAPDDEQIALSGLSGSIEQKMLGSLLGRDVELNALKAELLTRSKGIPLFIEEMVRILVDTGYLVGEPGNYL